MPETDIYKTFCEPRFDGIDQKVGDIHRVVCGNGSEGLSSIVRRHDRLINRMCWAIGVVFVAVIGAMVRMLIQ